MICFTYLSEWVNTERNKVLDKLIQQPKKEVQRTLLCTVKTGRAVIRFLTLIPCGEKKMTLTSIWKVFVRPDET